MKWALNFVLDCNFSPVVFKNIEPDKLSQICWCQSEIFLPMQTVTKNCTVSFVILMLLRNQWDCIQSLVISVPVHFTTPAG